MSLSSTDGSNPLSNLIGPPSHTYQSYEGMAYYAGLKIMKLANLSYSVNYTTGIFYEAGEDEGATYRGAPVVQGSIQKAYVNSMEWFLAFGKKSGQQGFEPKNSYAEAGFDINTILSADGISTPSALFTSTKGNKFYPIKFDMKIEVNTKGAVNSSDGKKYIIQATITGCIINTYGLNIGTGAAVIPIGPINFVAEEVLMKPVEDTSF